MRGNFYARYLSSLALAEREPGKHRWYSLSAKDDTTEVYVYDEIGFYGISAAQFVSDLKGIKTPNILLRLNTPGGMVTDGIAMFNALKEHPSKVTTCTDSLAASMGSILALAGSEKNGGGGVRMAKNAFFMVHNPWGFVIGDDEDMAKGAEVLGKMKGVLADEYAAKTGMPKEECLSVMKAESWYTAEEAKAAGFVDEIMGEVEPAASFDPGVFGLFRSVPGALLASFRPKQSPPAAQSAVLARRRRLELLDHQ